MNMHDLQMVLEAKLETGASLTPEQQHLLQAARRVTARYDRNGHRMTPTRTLPDS
jgi:hypothetical protein